MKRSTSITIIVITSIVVIIASAKSYTPDLLMVLAQMIGTVVGLLLMSIFPVALIAAIQAFWKRRMSVDTFFTATAIMTIVFATLIVAGQLFTP
jgi:hypothetical protein